MSAAWAKVSVSVRASASGKPPEAGCFVCYPSPSDWSGPKRVGPHFMPPFIHRVTQRETASFSVQKANILEVIHRNMLSSSLRQTKKGKKRECGLRQLCSLDVWLWGSPAVATHLQNNRSLVPVRARGRRFCLTETPSLAACSVRLAVSRIATNIRHAVDGYLTSVRATGHFYRRRLGSFPDGVLYFWPNTFGRGGRDEPCSTKF